MAKPIKEMWKPSKEEKDPTAKDDNGYDHTAYGVVLDEKGTNIGDPTIENGGAAKVEAPNIELFREGMIIPVYGSKENENEKNNSKKEEEHDK